MYAFKIVSNELKSQSRRKKKTTRNKNAKQAIINYFSYMFLLTSILSV